MNLLGDVAALATAVGVALAVFQLQRQRNLNRTAFEADLVRRYWDILDRLSLAARRGSPEGINDNDRCAAHSYFHLADEQAYLATKQSKVSRRTWRTWRAGIEATMKREPFRTEWSLVQEDEKLVHEYGDLRAILEPKSRLSG